MSNNLQDKQKQIILKMLTEKSVMKQDVFSNTIETFNTIKDCIKLKADDLNNELKKLMIEYKFNLKILTLKLLI